MQVNDLLSEVQLDYAKVGAVVEDLLHKLRKALASMQPREVRRVQV